MIGIVDCIEPNYTKCYIRCEDDSIQTINSYKNIGKVFLGDLVRVVDNKCFITKSNIKSKTIVGQLLFNTIRKFPPNKKGIERFEFRALNSSYPNFLVCSRLKKKYTNNVWCIIKFLSWDSTLPYGEIVNIIGNVNDLNSKYDTVLHNYNLNSKRQKSNIGEFCINMDDYKNYKNKTDNFVLSIDPKGTRDIDDCFEYKLENKGLATINIHIADVVGVLIKLDKMELLKNKSTSIYAPNKTLHMLPEILSQDILSLLPGKTRLAVSLEIKIRNNKIVYKNWYKSIIENKRAYSYGQFQELYYDKPGSHQYKIKEIIRTLKYKNMKQYEIEKFDTHLLIEKLMIIMNCESCEYIQLNNLNPIYRVHLGKYKSLDNIPNSINTKLLKFINIINSHSATYTLDKENLEHESLGISNYGHFTSPIRRIVDCYNHTLMHNILFKANNTLGVDIDNINNINKRIKKADREWGIIKLEEDIKTNNRRKYSGSIYMIRNNYMAYIYIAELNISLKKLLVKKPLQSKYKMYTENNVVYKLTDNDSGDVKEYILYEKIDLEIYIKRNDINPLNNLLIVLV